MRIKEKIGGLRLLVAVLFAIGGAAALMAIDEVQSRREALQNLIERASAGDAKALYDLGYLHDIGYDTIPVDSAKSSALYRLSAEKGYGPAGNYLGYRYINGEYLTQNVDSGLYWLAKAAGAGDASAANNLGYLLSNSDIVTRDYPQAVMWLSKAADAGVPTAKSLLADLLREGLGTTPDTLRAINLYTSAIEDGLQDAELKLFDMMSSTWIELPHDSIMTLGKFYYTHRAPFIGVSLFKKASEGGDATAFALLGDAYSRAIGVEYDNAKAIEYFLRGALGGNASAQFVIGELLEIFPDSLDTPQYNEIISDYGIDMKDANLPEFWYSLAKDGGVENAETAAELLLYH